MKYFVYGNDSLNHLKKKDKLFKEAIVKIGYIEREVNLKPFQSLIQQIVGQQISKQAAVTVFKRLKSSVEHFDAKSISLLKLEDIQKCGMTFIKARNIHTISLMVAKGEVDLEELEFLSDDDVIIQLTKLPGIGVWSAQMYLIFTLQRENIISYADLGIRKGMMKLYNLEKLDKKTFDIYKEKYSPYCSVASLYLWHIAHNEI